MIGAILGDMIGSPYEFDQGDKTKEFPLFIKRSHFTDDSVMTIAVAEALMNTLGKSDDEIKAALVRSMQKWGKKYPNAGYGGMFHRWLNEKHPEPYGSFGNGSAMRVSAAGWLFDTLEDTRHMAALTATVTHNHPEGIKGAEATAAAIFMARTGSTKEEIKTYIISEFGYDLSRNCDEIRPDYHHVETCQKTVPEAITAFIEGTDFEDVIRTAVSLGGDCDTLTCIAGGMAEAFYGVPAEIAEEGRKRLPDDMRTVLDAFQENRHYTKVYRTDWKAEPMPEKHDTFTLERHFSSEELQRLKAGHIPEEMEDKWFWYMENMRLYAHRSWTGICIFIVDISPDTNKHMVTVNREPEQYSCESTEEDCQTLNMLLDYWTKAQYDYYSEWLGETYNTLVKSGQIKPPREVIKETLENEMIDGLDYQGIKALMFAEGGAMGCPGEIRLFSLEDDKVYLRKNNFAYGNFEMDRFVEHFKPMQTLDYEMFGNLVHIEDGWQFIDLGVGNQILMTDELYEEFKKSIENKRPPEIYQMFEDEILRIIQNM